MVSYRSESSIPTRCTVELRQGVLLKQLPVEPIRCLQIRAQHRAAEHAHRLQHRVAGSGNLKGSVTIVTYLCDAGV